MNLNATKEIESAFVLQHTKLQSWAQVDQCTVTGEPLEKPIEISLDAERNSPASVCIGDSAFVFGGANKGGRVLGTFEEFDMIGNRASKTRQMDGPGRLFGCSAVCQAGYGYLLGGCTDIKGTGATAALWRLDPTDRTFTQMADMAQPRIAPAAVAVGNAKILVLGDMMGKDTLELYDCDMDKWTTIDDARRIPKDAGKKTVGWSAVYHDGTVYIYGGMNTKTSKPTGKGWKLRNPLQDDSKWEAMPDLSGAPQTHRICLSLAVAGNLLLVIGGSTGTAAKPVPVNTVEALDLTSDYENNASCWQAVPSLQTARQCCGVAVRPLSWALALDSVAQRTTASVAATDGSKAEGDEEADRVSII
jgi:hypothetical protein